MDFKNLNDEGSNNAKENVHTNNTILSNMMFGRTDFATWNLHCWMAIPTLLVVMAALRIRFFERLLGRQQTKKSTKTQPVPGSSSHQKNDDEKGISTTSRMSDQVSTAVSRGEEIGNQIRVNYPGRGNFYRRPNVNVCTVGSQGSSSRVSVHFTDSGDDLEDDDDDDDDDSGSVEYESSIDASTGTISVTDKQIMDPYGEKGVYTGALSKSTGMPHGKGRMEYEKEGRWYEGDWIHGRWTGFGRLSIGDGDFYEGGLKNDHKHGEGTMRFADGRVFEGNYIRGQMMEGKMTYQDGSEYNGFWVDEMRDGKGKCSFLDGSEYEGEFRKGNFHGHGKMTWNDGGWYVGEWCDGEMHGRGKEIRPNRTVRHDGEWSRGQPIRSARVVKN